MLKVISENMRLQTSFTKAVARLSRVHIGNLQHIVLMPENANQLM